MAGFDEAWLAQYQAKRAGAPTVTAPVWPLRFTLAKPTVLLNVLMRAHWSRRRKYQSAIASEVAGLVPLLPVGAPLQKAACVARLTPSGALTEALSRAMTLSMDWFGLAVLAVWGAVAALCALRWFRFT